MKGLLKIFPEKCTRNMHCPDCAESEMPRIGNLALLFGTDSQKFSVLNIKKDSLVREYGFTPHLIYNPRIQLIGDEQQVIFSQICCMNGCGVDLVFNPHNNLYNYSFEIVKKQVYSVERFLGLLNHKDPEYYLFAGEK